MISTWEERTLFLFWVFQSTSRTNLFYLDFSFYFNFNAILPAVCCLQYIAAHTMLGKYLTPLFWITVVYITCIILIVWLYDQICFFYLVQTWDHMLIITIKCFCRFLGILYVENHIICRQNTFILFQFTGLFFFSCLTDCSARISNAVC